MKRWVICLLVLLVLLAPSAAAEVRSVAKCSKQCTPTADDVNGAQPKRGGEAVWTILYPHFDGIQRAPTNIQPPHELYEKDLNRGFQLTPALSLPEVAGNPTYNQPPYMFIWYSSPGFVEFLDDGKPRFHTEFGLAEPLTLEGGEVILYLYLSPYNVPNENDEPGSAQVGAMPRVALDVKLETGRNPRARSATTIAEFDTGKDGLIDPNRADMVLLPGSQAPVYEFEIHMPIKNALIPDDPYKGGWVLSIILYQADEADSVKASQADWRVRTGPTFIPRLLVKHKEALVTKAAWMSVFDERLFVRWSVISPWGTSDLDERTLGLEVQGAQGVLPKKAVQDIIFKVSRDHNGHFVPANQTWAVPYAKLDLPDGEYTATGRIMNYQHTYELVQDWKFRIVDGQPALDGESAPVGQPQGVPIQPAPAKGKSPGFEPVLLLAAVALLGLVRLRRRA